MYLLVVEVETSLQSSKLQIKQISIHLDSMRHNIIGMKI